MFDFYLFNSMDDSIFLNISSSSLLKSEYLPVFILILFATFLSVLILSLSYILSVQNPETEKLSSYECGFEPYEDARHKFSVNFYIVAILFIVFDIEAMYLFQVSMEDLDTALEYAYERKDGFIKGIITPDFELLESNVKRVI